MIDAVRLHGVADLRYESVPPPPAPAQAEMPGALEALEGLGIDCQRRAETLPVADFVALARALGDTDGLT